MKVIALHSGGLDSTVLLYHLRAAGHELEALSVQYGQRHRRELGAAIAICEQLGVPQSFITVPIHDLAPTSSQTNSAIEVPLGHYEDPSMRVTVVPNRNMVLLALAIARAIATKAVGVAYAAHAGDHAIYPDCREVFIDAMREAAALCDYEPVRILTPFSSFAKRAIVTRGAKLGVPFELTYSCYQGRAQHCGQCGTCVERREAFERAGVADPTEYECSPAHAV